MNVSDSKKQINEMVKTIDAVQKKLNAALVDRDYAATRTLSASLATLIKAQSILQDGPA